jgi:acyl-CoA synthetase (AMP-forming)/AMP-acid ligase II
MGDLGYLDKKGRLWFCGRMSHRVETPHGLMLPVPCEAIFNQHPDVHRTALVGIGSSGKQYPVLVVEPKSGKYPRTRVEQQRFLQQLLELGSRNTKTQSIQHILFYPRPFPVDVRHNAKIYRLELGKWAARKLKGVDF